MKQVDKHFKDKLGHYESDVPADMWDRIAPALEEESRKTRPIFWLSFLGGLVVIGLFTGYFISSNTGGQISNTIDNEAVSGVIATPLAAASSETPSSVAKTESAVTTQNANNYGDVADVPYNGNTNGSLDAQSTSRLEETPYEKTYTAPVAISNIASSPSSNNSVGVANPPTSAENEVRLVITKSYFDGKEKVTNVNTTMTLVDDRTKNIQTLQTLQLPTINGLETEIRSDIDAQASLFGGNAPQCPSFIDERMGLFIDGYISHSYSPATLSGNSAYENLRNNTESASYSFGAGLRASIYLGKGFGFKSGLAFNQINDKFEFDDPNAQTKVTKIEEKLIDGVLVEVSREVIVTGRNIIHHNNVYRFLDIPVLAFYEFGSSKSPFYFSVNGGVNVNLLFTQSGKYLTPEGNVTAFTGDDEYPNPFKTNAGLSLYTSFGIHYVFNKNIDLVVEPHFSAQLGSITRDAAPLSQRYSTYGLNTGVRYKF